VKQRPPNPYASLPTRSSPQRCDDPLRPRLLSAPAAPALAPAGGLALPCSLGRLLLAEGGIAAVFVAAQTEGFAPLEALL
jgi:hypothetical protein